MRPPGKQGSLASVAAGTESERRGLQARLELFSGSLFVLSFGFSLLMGAVLISTGAATFSEFAAQRTNQVHLAANLVLLGFALVCRYASLGQRTLSLLDPALLWGVATLFGLMFSNARSAARPELVASLCTMTICVFRAVLIPSTTLRTLVITAVGAAPCVAVAWVAHRVPEFTNMGGGQLTRAGITLYTGIWWLVEVVVATLTTRVIYGLRQRVREARQLGQYVLEQKLGEGGMGIVYRARHALLRRPTAVKLLAEEQVGEKALERFAREVRLTARLTHPNTVTIYDYGRTPEDIFYYAMELLDGIDLEKLVRNEGAMPAARVRYVLAQIAEALAEAHAIGLIHRDVKPANIMLCRQIARHEMAKLLDFGLVKDLSDPKRTRSGVQSLTGTPLYMAPESIMTPERTEPRSDLYALGAVGYFMLTGAPVFGGSTIVEACTHHLHTEPVPPSQRLGKPTSAGLERVILRCLEKDPARRYESAERLVAELLRIDDAGTWTIEDARDWWERHPTPSNGALATAEPSPAPDSAHATTAPALVAPPREAPSALTVNLRRR